MDNNEHQERESDIGDDSPGSHNDEDMSDGESGRDQDDESSDEVRRHLGTLHDHGNVLARLKMQVNDIRVGDDFETAARHLSFPPSLGTSRGLTAQESLQLGTPFPFTHPGNPFLPPVLQTSAATPSSGNSSDGSASSSHNNTWSFEEQFKQVRQLYEINDDPNRKEFLDDLFSFMQKRGSPINRLPIMAKSVLDLYELYNLVVARGGLVDVINKKLWQEIIKGLRLPSSITSAAFTLRTQYMKYLYPYECEKKGLSTPAELQIAIDGNRREGRRTSYNQYDSIHQRSPNPQSLNPLSLVSQQQQLAARMSSVMTAGLNLSNGAHHPSHPQPLGQPLNGGPLAGLAPHDIEARMMEYVRFLNKGIGNPQGTPPTQGGDCTPPHVASPLNQLDMTRMTELSRMTLWNLYNNNQSAVEPQKEALNLSDPQPTVKREAERELSPPPPPPKKFSVHEDVHNDDDDDYKDEDEPKEDEEDRDVVPSMATHIKISSRGGSRNGDSSLVVSMELNGITYQGVLFAQNAAPTTAAAAGRTEIAS